MYLAGGELKVFEPASAFPELKEGRLLELVERFALISSSMNTQERMFASYIVKIFCIPQMS